MNNNNCVQPIVEEALLDAKTTRSEGNCWKIAWEYNAMLSGWRCFSDACLIYVLRFGTVFESKVALTNKRLGIGVFNGFIGEPFGKRPTLSKLSLQEQLCLIITLKINFVWNISFKTNCVWNISFKVVQISPRASNWQRWASTTGCWRIFRLLSTSSYKAPFYTILHGYWKNRTLSSTC